MNKKLIGTSLAIMLSVASFGSTNAFGFGGQGQDGQRGQRGEMHQRAEMTQERFDEMKAMFNKYTNVADFIAAKKLKMEERKAEHEAMKDSVTKNVEKISNGIIVTVTSDDAAVVEKIQNKEHRDPKNEEITRTIENISNGVKMTITSDNSDLVEKIQNHEDRMGKRGNRMNHQGRGGERGEEMRNSEGKMKGRMNKVKRGDRFAKFRQRMMEKFNR